MFVTKKKKKKNVHINNHLVNINYKHHPLCSVRFTLKDDSRSNDHSVLYITSKVLFNFVIKWTGLLSVYVWSLLSNAFHPNAILMMSDVMESLLKVSYQKKSS